MRQLDMSSERQAQEKLVPLRERLPYRFGELADELRSECFVQLGEGHPSNFDQGRSPPDCSQESLGVNPVEHILVHKAFLAWADQLAGVCRDPIEAAAQLVEPFNTYGDYSIARVLPRALANY